MSNITIQELQQKLENVETLIGLLVRVVDEKMPTLSREIEKIVGTIQGGFNTTRLTEQVQTSINSALNESDYGSLMSAMHSVKIQLTAEIKDWKRETEAYQETSKIKLIAISGLSGVALGVLLTMLSSNSSNEYRNILTKLENQPNCNLAQAETGLTKTKKYNN
jgi:ElaB/YqjD/DUF883 family membrane-anchored ribosome-binding protein